MSYLSPERAVAALADTVEAPGFGFLTTQPTWPWRSDVVRRVLRTQPGNACCPGWCRWALMALWHAARVVPRAGSPPACCPRPLDVASAAWTLELPRGSCCGPRARSAPGGPRRGLAIGGGLGLLLGLLTGSVRWAETLLDSSIQMVRNIPALALIPLVILWFGIDESAKLFLIAVSVFFPIYLNTFHGIRNVDPGLIEMGAHLRPQPLAALHAR